MVSAIGAKLSIGCKSERVWLRFFRIIQKKAAYANLRQNNLLLRFLQ